MNRFKQLLKKVYTPVTIIFIPHKKKNPLSLKLPAISIALTSFFIFITFLVISGCIIIVAININDFYIMKDKVNFYEKEFISMKDTINFLKKSEAELNKIISYKTKEQIYENLFMPDTGSVDIDLLKDQINETMERIGDLKDHISQQRDIYFSTPMGWPIEGYISSYFGYRVHPKAKKRIFHGGIDIASKPNNPVSATADGVVIFAGWSGKNGKLVVLKHNHGFTTCYAHNKKIVVKVGQKVKRGDTIAYVGSTGRSTGPHVHYEVWIDGKRVNPQKYL